MPASSQASRALSTASLTVVKRALPRVVEAQQVAVLGEELADADVALAGRHRLGGRPPAQRAAGRRRWRRALPLHHWMSCRPPWLLRRLLCSWLSRLPCPSGGVAEVARAHRGRDKLGGIAAGEAIIQPAPADTQRKGGRKKGPGAGDRGPGVATDRTRIAGNSFSRPSCVPPPSSASPRLRVRLVFVVFVGRGRFRIVLSQQQIFGPRGVRYGRFAQLSAGQ